MEERNQDETKEERQGKPNPRKRGEEEVECEKEIELDKNGEEVSHSSMDVPTLLDRQHQRMEKGGSHGESKTSLAVTQDEGSTDDQGETSRHRDRKDGGVSVMGAPGIVPGALAVRGSPSINRDDDGGDNDEEDEAEVEVTSSANNVYMVQATPVEEIVATQVVPEDTATKPESGPQEENGKTVDEDNRNKIAKWKKRPHVDLNVETVDFDEQVDDGETGLGVRDNEEAPKRFANMRNRYVLAIVIIVAYMLITAFTIFGLAVHNDDRADNDNDVCEATKAQVYNNLQVLKGFGFCAYIFANTQLFIMIFEWRRSEQDDLEEGSRMAIPFLCSQASTHKQIDNPLTAVVYLLLNLFWFLFVVAMRVCFGVEGLGRFREDILKDCPELRETDVPTLSKLSIIITVQMVLLLYVIGMGIAQVFFAKKPGEEGACPDRRKTRTLLLFWLIELVLFSLSTASVFACTLPTIEKLQDL